MNPDFINIDNVTVNTEIVEKNFNCDLNRCKGACCTMESQFGAPISQHEVKTIEEILPIVKKYLPNEHLKEIERNRFWIESHGEYMTRSLNNRACVFVVYEGDIAKCAIEKAYCDGKVDFIKPVSCHLFPIRVTNFGGPVLRYERYSECEPAINKGNKSGTKILDFCRAGLEREFGNEWFEKTREASGI